MIRRALLVLLLSGSLAHADDTLGPAKLAIEEVRYDDAQRLLIAALERGGNAPLAMRELYKLLGASAVALGKTDDAEKYYRAWLALEPTASLDAGASPKLRAPFDAAKSFITANGPLDVTAERLGDRDVRVRVISDPLALARTVRSGETSVPLADRVATVTNASGTSVDVLDRYGNTLAEVRATASLAQPVDTAPITAPTTYAPPATRPRRSSTAFYALAVPTGLLLATGVGFGAASIIYNGKVQQALDDSGTAYYTDVVDDQKKVTQFWKLSAIIGGAGLVLAVPTTILYLRSRETTVVPFVGGGGGGVSLSGRF